jgi:hypothetical protein
VQAFIHVPSVQERDRGPIESEPVNAASDPPQCCFNAYLPTGDNTMRPTIIIGTVTLIIALVAIWNTDGIIANPGRADFVASPSMDVMQMMKDMKDLPEQQYDAF